MNPNKPIVLVLAGGDPTGGAGIQADIEAIGALGGHAAPVICAVTAQDTRNVSQVYPLPETWVLAQAEAVLGDLPVAAIKIGLLGSLENLRVTARIIRRAGEVPVVLDPVLAAGGGRELSDDALRRAIVEELLPLVTVLTPNGPEARRLSGLPELAGAAARLLEHGCGHVLLTGGHEPGGTLINTLHGPASQSWSWPRLPGEYHGSGCTLASALAVGLAQGLSVPVAAERAQAFTWRSLAEAFSPGRGQSLPDRWRGKV